MLSCLKKNTSQVNGKKFKIFQSLKSFTLSIQQKPQIRKFGNFDFVTSALCTQPQKLLHWDSFQPKL